MTDRCLSDWRMVSTCECPSANPQSPDTDSSSWRPVTVPTTVQSALVECGEAPSPWLDVQSMWFEQIENDTWWFRTEFEPTQSEADADRFELVFEGVAVFATVWLNGNLIGSMRNAYHEHRFDVTRHIRRDGANILAVECRLGVEETTPMVSAEFKAAEQNVRPYLRTPQMTFGWDFAPRLPLVGPWRPVRLETHTSARIEDCWVQTLGIEGADGASATLSIETTIDSVAPRTGPLTLTLSICEDSDSPPVWEESAKLFGDGPVSSEATIANPRLWWPQPVGEPFRYTLVVRLSDGETLLAERTERFGIRTVEILQDGEFTFSINGRRVFAKGANWVPTDSLTLEASDERYRHLLELARDANYNMLRVWGGGIYEPKRFYDLCDEFGIMVWQDFMYACAMYPDYIPEFLESAQREAEVEVTRLRRHPSVVLWCGNNEVQEAWMLGEWQLHVKRFYGERLFDHILPNTVAALCPGTPYWPGSPYGGPTTRSRTEGDFHDWYSLPNWKTYDENAPLFSSEYGFRGMPQKETLDAAISPESQWEPRSPQHIVWKHHHGWCGWTESVLPEFGTAKTLDEYTMLSQEAQATLMRYAVEVYRRRMFGTSGSLIWMYNEPWPAITFSVVDYFGRQKAAHFWVGNAYAPVMVMVHEKDMSVWAANDLDTEPEYNLRVRRFDHSGRLLGELRTKGALGANTATQLLTQLPDDLRIVDECTEFLHVELNAAGAVSERVFHSAKRRDWVLEGSEISTTVERINDKSVRIELTSTGYTHFASVSVDDPMATYSNNFVDLLPGEPREVIIRTSSGGNVVVRSANAAGEVVQELPI
jgi:beta-mannosidase